MLKLREYQEKGIWAVSMKLRSIKKVIFQLATGGGKTVVLAAIAYRYSLKSGKKVLILVHRSELLDQTIKMIFKWYDLISFPIAKGASKKMQHGHPIYVGMVETVARMYTKLPEIGLVIMDETHIGNFKKIHDMFPNALFIGFSATPISATKKEPLNMYFDDIVCGVDIPELIELNKKFNDQGLVPNKTYAIKGAVDRKSLAMAKNGLDFDEKAMGDEFSKGQNVINALEAYNRLGEGKKAIVFNCSVEHSLIVAQVFKNAGLPVRHLDSGQGGITEDGRILEADAWRKDCIKWYRSTPGAILCNIGILTTGFDEPSVEVVIVNRATQSLSLWLQMTGRGSRPWVCSEYTKKHFTIIDLGANAITHGDWCDARDWEQIFINPPKPGQGGVAPVKECPNCEAIVPAPATICKECGYHFEFKEMKYDQEPLELVLITKDIKVKELTETAKEKGYKEYYPLFEVARQISTKAKLKLGAAPMDLVIFTNLISLYNEKAKEWYNSRGERLTDNKKKFTNSIFEREILKHFKPWESNANHNI